jgi:hypothetical protein
MTIDHLRLPVSHLQSSVSSKINSNLISIFRKTYEMPLQPPPTVTIATVTFSLTSDATFEVLVFPLAAILLGYLVAYLPYSSYTNTLSGVPLDFYEYINTILAMI